MTRSNVLASARRIGPFAWPVFVGQVSLVAFATLDTALVARHSTTDLAALAIGTSAYITIFVGLMGIVMALSPLVGRAHGGGDPAEAGRQVHQAVWIALALSLLGSLALLVPGPFLAITGAAGDIAARLRTYLAILAVALPASLLFTVYRAFNVAISRPRAVMQLQVAGLAVKAPLSWALVGGLPALGVPALGVAGCAISTAVVMWLQALAGAWLLHQGDYARYRLQGRGLDRPDRARLVQQLRLGLPMGASILLEVTAFSFMALCIARLGATAVASHHIAANVASLVFMVPLAIANATTTLCAQALGARRDDDARRLARHGLAIGLLCALAASLALLLSRHAIVALYTGSGPQADALAAGAATLLAIVALFHVADALQTISAFTLRAWHVATVPMLIYAVALWGPGQIGGHWLAFGRDPRTPAALHGPVGYWVASTAGLWLAAAALLGWQWRVMRRGRGPAAEAAEATPASAPR